MKAAYAHRPLAESAMGSDYLKLIWSNDASPAQSPEALQVSKKIQESLEWRMRAEAIHIGETPLYAHIAPRLISSVKCHYKYVGRMSPRQFPLDE